jgi:hypothetical protein
MATSIRVNFRMDSLADKVSTCGKILNLSIKGSLGMVFFTDKAFYTTNLASTKATSRKE